MTSSNGLLLLRRELEILARTGTDYLLHEHLEEVNTPLYFHQFVERSHAEGLQYLGDADVPTMLTRGLAPAVAETVMPEVDQQRLLRALHAAPQGVRRWSQQAPGVVETSLNLGVLTLDRGTFEAVFMLRSLVDAAATELASEVCDLFALAGMETRCIGTYPGWRPNPASPLLARARRVFAREFGGEAELKVIHAGLECGLIGGAYPRMDMISFGPDITGAHAPGEGVRVDTVAKCWQLLRALLADLARPEPATAATD